MSGGGGGAVEGAWGGGGGGTKKERNRFRQRETICRKKNNNSINNNKNLNQYCIRGAGMAQWLQRRTRDLKVSGPSPGRSGGIIFFSTV